MAISLLKFLKGLVVQNESDRSKELEVSVSSSATTGTRTVLQSAQTANRTLTLPDDSANLVGDDSTQTLTNKTIDADSNTITNIENADIKTGAAIARDKLASGSANRVAVNDGSGVLSDAAAITADRALVSDANGIPTHSVVTGTELASLSGVTGAALSQTNTVAGITNKTFVDQSTLIQDDVDGTKQFKFEASGITTGTTRTLTVPDLDDTLVVRTSTETLSNKTLDNSTVLTIEDSNLTIQDNSDNTKQLQLQLSGITTGTTRTLTAPDANTTIVGADAAQVITNKDIDGGIASNARRITVPKDTKANLDTLTRKEGTIVFATDEDKLYVDDGSQLVGTGGLDTVQFTIANNQSSAVNITGFLINQASNKAFTSNYSIVRRYQGTIGPAAEDTAFASNGGTQLNNIVYGSLIQPDGKILVGGTFTSYDGTSTTRLARINADGTLDTTFNTNIGSGFSGVSNSVETLGLLSDGRIVVTGSFDTFNGNTRNALVMLNADGTENSTFATNIGTAFDATGFGVEIAVQSDNKILIGGIFTSFNGNARSRLIRLNADGTEDTSFYTNLGTSFGGTVNTVHVQTDGKILVGGNFTSLNGNTRNRIVRLNSDGTEDSAFYTALTPGANGIVEGIRTDSSGNIFVCGQFSTFAGSSRDYLVKLNSSGVEQASFYTNLGTGFNGAIDCIEVTVDDQLLAAGGFTSFDGNSAERAVRLNNNGIEDTAFTTILGAGFNVTVRTISVSDDRTMVFGGQFTDFNGNTRNRIVKINEPETGSSELMEVGTFSGVYRPSNSSWSLLNETFSGDDSGVTLSINSSGQLQYTSTNLSGTLLESQSKFTIIKL